MNKHKEFMKKWKEDWVILQAVRFIRLGKNKELERISFEQSTWSARIIE